MNQSRFLPVKAYKNQAFINSADARILRILSEYIEPQARFRDLQVRDTIVIFGSARIPSREQARRVWRRRARRAATWRAPRWT